MSGAGRVQRVIGQGGGKRSHSRGESHIRLRRPLKRSGETRLEKGVTALAGLQQGLF